MWRNLLGTLAPRSWRSQVCEACGERFECGASLSGCWCSEVQLSGAQRKELSRRYRRCLCRNCLERFAKGGTRNDARAALS